jgi:hypothetical protein
VVDVSFGWCSQVVVGGLFRDDEAEFRLRLDSLRTRSRARGLLTLR